MMEVQDTFSSRRERLKLISTNDCLHCTEFIQKDLGNEQYIHNRGITQNTKESEIKKCVHQRGFLITPAIA